MENNRKCHEIMKVCRSSFRIYLFVFKAEFGLVVSGLVFVHFIACPLRPVVSSEMLSHKIIYLHHNTWYIKQQIRTGCIVSDRTECGNVSFSESIESVCSPIDSLHSNIITQRHLLVKTQEAYRRYKKTLLTTQKQMFPFLKCLQINK